QALRRPPRFVSRMPLCWTFVFAVFIGASFIVERRNEISLVWLASFFVVGLAALMGARRIQRSLLGKWAAEGRLDRRTVIVGADQNGEQLLQALKAQRNSDIVLLGVFDDRNDDRIMDTCAGVPKLGKVDDIAEFARRPRVDLVLFALPIPAET